MIFLADSSATKIHVLFTFILSFDQKSVVCQNHRRGRNNDKFAAVHHARDHILVHYPSHDDLALQKVLLLDRHNFQHILLPVLRPNLLDHLERVRLV